MCPFFLYMLTYVFILLLFFNTSCTAALLHVRELEEAEENANRKLLESQDELDTLRSKIEDVATKKNPEPSVPKNRNISKLKEKKAAAESFVGLDKSVAIEILKSLSPSQVPCTALHCPCNGFCILYTVYCIVRIE